MITVPQAVTPRVMDMVTSKLIVREAANIEEAKVRISVA